jgi:hypothetical protein
VKDAFVRCLGNGKDVRLHAALFIEAVPLGHERDMQRRKVLLGCIGLVVDFQLFERIDGNEHISNPSVNLV